MGGKTVGTGFDSPPILPAGDGYGGNRVHYSLVMGSGAERVGFGEVIGLQHTVDDI